MPKQVKMSVHDVTRSAYTIARLDAIIDRPLMEGGGKGTGLLHLGSGEPALVRTAIQYFRNQIEGGKVARMHLLDDLHHLSATITDEK